MAGTESPEFYAEEWMKPIIRHLMRERRKLKKCLPWTCGSVHEARALMIERLNKAIPMLMIEAKSRCGESTAPTAAKEKQ